MCCAVWFSRARLVLHPHDLCPFFLLVFFLVEPGVMVLGFDDGGGASGVLATGGKYQQEEEKNVKGEFSHAMLTAKIALFA